VRDYNTTLLEAGIDPGCVDITQIGVWQHAPTTDKPSRKNGRVIVFSTRPLQLWFTNHRTKVSGYYSESGGFLSRLDHDRMKSAMIAQRRERDSAQAEAASLAEKVWRESRPADPMHPYLQTKRVKPHGLRQLEDGHLIVPLVSAGLLWNVQTISPGGEKRFLKGGRKNGCYFSIGPKPTTALVLAEGFATAATLYEALELPVAVCFDAGNLIHASDSLRAKYPRCAFIFAADNDAQTEGNPGLAYATKAARGSGSLVVYPQFGLAATRAKLTDWNDYGNLYGLAAVRFCFDEVLANVG
jgi:putative DNA primase/helicase